MFDMAMQLSSDISGWDELKSGENFTSYYRHVDENAPVAIRLEIYENVDPKRWIDNYFENYMELNK